MRLKTKRKSGIKRLLTIVLVICLLPVGWVLVQRMEGTVPEVGLNLTSSFLGASDELVGNLADKDTGLKSVRIALSRGEKEVVLLEKSYPASDLVRGGSVSADPIRVLIEPKKLGLSDGNALLKVRLTDYSWRSWFKGNTTLVTKNMVIDTKPPGVNVLTRSHNVTQGGAGLVIYSVSEADAKSGINVDGNFFPGHSGGFSDAKIHMAFFALGHSPDSGKDIFVTAEDPAGNTARAGIPYYVRKKRFKRDTIGLSDRFLNWKVPEFNVAEGEGKENPLLEKFLVINGRMRRENTAKVLSVGDKTENEIFWKGSFLRLPAAAPRAGFADHRSYRYKGEVVDKQFHMGVDLASIAHSPIPAANSGKVVLVDDIGIYGKTVIIDHGYGLFSLYSHMNSIDVAEGETVKRGDVLGRTGVTGMAGGDHLHYGMIIHNTFVNPIEWWDASWIKNNISSKIKDMKSLYQ